MPNIPTPSAWTKTWLPELDLKAPAGLLLKRVVEFLPAGERITLFGSAPLQLALDRQFLSAEVHCFGSAALAEAVSKAGLDQPGESLYVQVCSELNFRTSPRWKDRVFTFQIGGCHVIVPHPIDILIGKLIRMEEKDLKAFELVRLKTGHPTEEELILELQWAVDLFRPGFNEETDRDMKVTTRFLWQNFFGKDIDVREMIIAPALAIRKAGYSLDVSKTDHRGVLREAAARDFGYHTPGRRSE